MVNLPATLAALLAVALFVLGMAAMTGGSLGPAGVSFLSASVVIYLREAYLVAD